MVSVVAAETSYTSVLDNIETVVDWQEENPHRCARCGVEFERPLNRSKHDRRILLCDGCVFIDTVLFTPELITSSKEQTAHDFWDANEWVAFK